MLVLFLTVYFGLLLGFGIFSYKKVESSDDYFLAGRNLSVRFAAPSIVATWFGAGSCVGVAASMYSGGVEDIIADPFGCTLSLVLCSLFFASALRKRGLTTINEILGKTYGETLERGTSILTIPFYVGTLGAQFLAIGILLNFMTQLPLELCVLVSACVVLFYTLIGGLWAVVLTDGLQLAILTVSLCTLAWPIFTDSQVFFSCVSTLWNESSALLPSEHPVHGTWNYWGQWLMTGFGAMMGQDLIQRVLACKSERTARASTLLAGAMYLTLGMIPILIGVYARSLFQQIDDPQHVVPMLAESLNSQAIYALFLTGILSITMSTADSYLLAGATVITQNVMPLKSRQNLKNVRWVSLLMTAGAVIVALWIRDIYSIMVHSGAFLSVAIFVPVAGALVLRSPHSLSGKVSSVSGILGWLAYIIYYFSAADLDHLLYASAFVGMVSSLSAYSVTHIYCNRRIIHEKQKVLV